MFSIVGDGLAEMLDLIFKVLVGTADWRLDFAGILQIDDMVLSLDELMLVFFFPVDIVS